MGWSRDLFRALWRTLSKEVKEQVGTDRFGNKYYYIPEYKNWRGQTIREKRIVEAANKREVDYEVGDIPTEWEVCCIVIWPVCRKYTKLNLDNYKLGLEEQERLHLLWRNNQDRRKEEEGLNKGNTKE
ncbi:NADH dehydrogenase [ubiquinone] 1 alpha subcomplex assembly factor 2 isoform X2 [Diceros bicornis minor]|uniref:NADH dehydrogenase [ubiquinone] 1 alpha subcomplex assembly factor 2 isoform X2 n=1 Tax=Diceros bicornis minor TaxID=77932 RepID=UPI0026ECDC80|nr:NADH dehydrogenase [ubiquinone] 1 alpha subcomplex assembly factor 2 isoform X2 [Diceros bicornis minor]